MEENTFGEWLREFRKDNNLTQEDMAAALNELLAPRKGYLQEDLSRYENNKATDLPYRLETIMYITKPGTWQHEYGKYGLHLIYPQL